MSWKKYNNGEAQTGTFSAFDQNTSAAAKLIDALSAERFFAILGCVTLVTLIFAKGEVGIKASDLKLLGIYAFVCLLIIFVINLLSRASHKLYEKVLLILMVFLLAIILFLLLGVTVVLWTSYPG